MYKLGDQTPPWGIPAVNSRREDVSLLATTNKLLCTYQIDRNTTNSKPYFSFQHSKDVSASHSTHAIKYSTDVYKDTIQHPYTIIVFFFPTTKPHTVTRSNKTKQIL